MFYAYTVLQLGRAAADSPFARDRERGVHHAFVRWSHLFVVSAGVSLGFSGVWTAHFVGMAALDLLDCAGHEVEITFDLLMTLVSLAFACTGGVMAVSILLPAFSTRILPDATASAHDTPGEVDSTLLDNGDQLHQPPARRWPWRRAALLTFCTVYFVGSMHYAGLEGMRGSYRPQHHPPMVFASCAVLVAVATVISLGTLRRARPRVLASVSVRVAASCAGATAVMTFHYMSMAGTVFVAAPPRTSSEHGRGSLHLDATQLLAVSLVVGLAQLTLCQHGAEMLSRARSEEVDVLNRRRQEEERVERLITIESSFEFPMVLVTLSKLRAAGRMPLHEDLRDTGALTFLDSPAHAY